MMSQRHCFYLLFAYLGRDLMFYVNYRLVKKLFSLTALSKKNYPHIIYEQPKEVSSCKNKHFHKSVSCSSFWNLSSKILGCSSVPSEVRVCIKRAGSFCKNNMICQFKVYLSVSRIQKGIFLKYFLANTWWFNAPNWFLYWLFN